jgi:predicted molibdopterin-dependent oxidoreductase YjgC
MNMQQALVLFGHGDRLAQALPDTRHDIALRELHQMHRPIKYSDVIRCGACVELWPCPTYVEVNTLVLWHSDHQSERHHDVVWCTHRVSEPCPFPPD